MLATLAAVSGCEPGEPPTDDLAKPRSAGAAESTASNPVIWSVAVVPASGKAGDIVVLQVRASIRAGWSIHPIGAAGGPVTATTIELQLPEGLEAVGVWEPPMATRPFDKPGSGLVYEGNATFRRALKLAHGQPAGNLEIVCKVGFQACDADFCLRPETISLTSSVFVQ